MKSDTNTASVKRTESMEMRSKQMTYDVINKAGMISLFSLMKIIEPPFSLYFDFLIFQADSDKLYIYLKGNLTLPLLHTLTN